MSTSSHRFFLLSSLCVGYVLRFAFFHSALILVAAYFVFLHFEMIPRAGSDGDQALFGPAIVTWASGRLSNSPFLSCQNISYCYPFCQRVMEELGCLSHVIVMSTRLFGKACYDAHGTYIKHWVLYDIFIE